MYKQKYVGTPYYERTLFALKETETPEKNKIFFANITASLLENNPEIDAELIFSRIKTLKEVSFDPDVFADYTMSDLDGFHDLRTRTIYINPYLIEENTKEYYITLAHEFIHQISNDAGIRGLENELYPNINEILTQINAYNVCLDLDIETKQKTTFFGELSYVTYGPAYENINRTGDSLLIYKKEDFMKAFFNSDYELIFFDTVNRSTFKNLERALEMERYQFDATFFINSKMEIERCKQNLILLESTFSKPDFEKYFTFCQQNERNNVYFINDKKYAKNIISSHIEESDIMMWGLSQGMDLKRLNSEIGSKHNENITDFTHGIELLKRFGETFTLDDIKNAEILKVKEQDLEYITIRIKDKEIKGVGKYINGEFYISSQAPDNVHTKTFGEYKRLVFEEKDLTKNISDKVVFDNNAIYRFILNKEDSEKASLYASYEGLMTGVVMPPHSSEDLFKLFQKGKFNDVIKNFDVSSLYFEKDDTGKMGIEYKLEEGYHWKKALYDIYRYCKKNGFKDFPFEMDIENLSKKHKTNVLNEICSHYPEMLPAMIKKGNIDLNFRYNNEDILTNFHKKMKTFHFSGERGNYTWLIKNGINLFATTPEGVPFYEEVLRKGNLADLRELLKEPEFHPIIYSPLNKEHTIFELVMNDTESRESLTKLRELIKEGFDINMKNKDGLNLLESLISNKENLNESFLRRAVLEILETDIDLNHCSNSKTSITTSNYLACLNPNLISEIIVSPASDIYLCDIFNQNTPIEWIDRFSDKEMEDLKWVQDDINRIRNLLEFTEFIEKDFNISPFLEPAVHEPEMMI